MSREVVIMKCRVDAINEILQDMADDMPMDDVIEAVFSYHADRIVEVVNELMNKLEKAEYERFYGGNK